MEQVKANADWAFLGRKPFGVLILAQTLLPFLIFVGIFLAPYVFEGIPWVRGWSLFLFLSSLFFLLGHVFSLHRKAIQIGQAAIYIPFTLLMFFTALIFMFLYAFSTLLSLISFFDSLNYSPRLVITYAIITCLCAALTFVLARLAILIYRTSPNSKIQLLTTVVLDGEKGQRMDALPTHFTPAGTPMGGPQPASA